VSSTIESLADFVHDPALADHAEMRMERLRLHLADAMGMILQRARLVEGKTAMALGSRLAGWCACARLTEADDIHLTSCTTSGSVIVPTALHFATAGLFQTWQELHIFRPSANRSDPFDPWREFPGGVQVIVALPHSGGFGKPVLVVSTVKSDIADTGEVASAPGLIER
jgi:hypothetical protein